MVSAPILCNKLPSRPLVFTPAALLREARRQKGLENADVPAACILAVEMEAAALYAFAAAPGVRVLGLARFTNTMGLVGDDFEKGEADGTRDASAVLGDVIGALNAL